MTEGRRRGLTGKNSMKKFVDAMEVFRDEDELLSISYEVAYGYAKGADIQAKKAGVTEVSLSKMKEFVGA